MLDNAAITYKHMLKVIAISSIALSISITEARTLWESEDARRNINLIGFAHIDLAEFDDSAEQRSALPIDEGFQKARLAGHLSARLGKRVTTFIEAEVTVTEDDIDLEVERAIVKYDIDNSSQFSVGRYHAPVGYWNQFYHHGRWLQISKDRPVQTEFGLGFLPAHFWGAMYEKRVSSERYIIDFDVAAGGGRTQRIRIPDFAGPVTVSGDESVVAQINISPASNRNLTVGASLWLGDLSASSGLQIDEQIFTAHFNYKMVSGEFLAEVSAVQHDYNDGRAETDSYGGYLQYSHRLTALEGRLQPYLRLDFLDIDRDDFLYTSIESQDRQSLGIRYDITDNTTIKFELRRDDFTDLDESVNSLHGQLAAFF